MEQNVKQFRKRNAILSCLRCTHVHPSAEDLHRMLQAEHPDISLATVYRNLSLFKRQGLIRSLGAVDGIERFDADTSPHVHFICTGCGAVIDLPQLPRTKSGGTVMKKFVCTVCGYVYEGDELPEDYECPLCGVGADMFEEQE